MLSESLSVYGSQRSRGLGALLVYGNVGNVGSVYLGIVRYSTKMPDARRCRDFRTFSLWFVFSELVVVYEQSDTSLMQTSLLHWPKALTVT